MMVVHQISIYLCPHQATGYELIHGYLYKNYLIIIASKLTDVCYSMMERELMLDLYTLISRFISIFRDVIIHQHEEACYLLKNCKEVSSACGLGIKCLPFSLAHGFHAKECQELFDKIISSTIPF